MADETRADTKDSEIKAIREEYAYAREQKREIREEGDTDMVYLTNPWKAKENQDDKTKRNELGRPMIEADELSQYVNQLINDVRQNKRGIRVAPAGDGATDKTADLRQSLIRQIEYRSNAALDAYPVMFENTAQRSYGYMRIKPDYENHQSFDQELRIYSVPNPNMVTEDPHGLAADGSDWKFLYFAESWGEADFRRRWPGAQFHSFDSEQLRAAKDWLSGTRVLVAERWRIVAKKRTLLLIQPPAALDPQTRQMVMPPPFPVFKDALDLASLPPGGKVIRDRQVDYPTVKQQITNGVEVLEEKDFPGTSIPFVPCYGKIMFVDDGSGPKKRVLSLIRLARSPQMLYCYYKSQQAEMAGMIPKVPVQGYRGQFAGVEDQWQRAPHEPMAFIEIGIPENWKESWGPPPLPQRLAYEAGSHLQALELCAEGARRAIQAAIGASPLPTQAQRRNEKSGVALKQMEDAAQKGSFHFIDHFDLSLTRAGQILNELIPHYYDAARDVTVRKPDDQPSVVRINDPDHQDAVSATDGQHDVTISVGPRQISEREAASDFADSILQSNMLSILPPEKQAQIYALAIRLKSVGPLGDEMADIISPKQDGKPSLQDLQSLQQQVQQLQQQLQEATQALETEHAKQQATIEKAHIDNAGRIAVARINAAKDALNAEAEAQEERLSTGLTLLHDAHQNERDREHDVGMAALSAQTQADAADAAHGRTLEAGDVAHQQALDQQENQAALQPPSEGA